MWLLLALAVLTCGLLVWHSKSEREAGTTAAKTQNAERISTSAASSTAVASVKTSNSSNSAALKGQAKKKDPLKYRLANTPDGIGRLARNDKAILLQNALIDSTKPLNFTIPDSLKSKGDPGSYIVQSRGPLSSAFRAALASAGASIVSYIPNNAYLVRASAGVAQQLSGNPLTQSVLPFEPYYKLSPSLLGVFMEQQDVPLDTVLNVVVFADAHDATVASLKSLNAQVMGETTSPFGPLLTVKPAEGTLADIAGLPGVQVLSARSRRQLANDLSRARVNVSTNTITPVNYLNLGGSNVWVAVNDSGIDATHPDLGGPLSPGPLRVFSPLANGLVDYDGHGTHVAGTIAGDGFESMTVSNAIGSIMPGTNGQFRGMAPLANLFSMPIDFFSDFQLQEAAARTNALISNNGWNYLGDDDYDIYAASYDAAVRDALPEVTGSQPVLFVFSAGNGGSLSLHDGSGGSGDDDGTGGSSETIESPATAKNVITVGALEQPRFVTNSVYVDDTNNTSQPWLGDTDSDNEVAAYSGRGNVGIGFEGDNGRYKPDVVAPGSFVVSLRSSQWLTNLYYSDTNYDVNTFENQVVNTNGLNNYSITIPDNALQLIITVASTNPAVPIYVNQNTRPSAPGDLVGYNQYSISIPALITANQLFYSVGDPLSNAPVTYDITTTLISTNDVGDYYQVLQGMNDSLGGTNGEKNWYRYETGTSMAAAGVSGVLALMQDFFQQNGITNSPAMTKALLINGSREVNPTVQGYDFQVTKTSPNYEGWGLVDITNSIPENVLSNGTAFATAISQGPSPILMFDQSPTNALATGDSRTYNITMDPAATTLPLRITLVWTDPAGNPAASIKLVNTLGLVVTNDDTGDVFYGNDFQSGADFVFPTDTNSAPNIDVVNNVQNVYLAPNLGTNYSITVIGRTVNVNAVTAQTNNVVQDYALVISSGNGEDSNAISLSVSSPIVATTAAYTNVTVLTNQFGADVPDLFGQVANNQRAGANSPLIGTNLVADPADGGFITVGETNQWHFYIITNSSSFTNAVFATSLPIDLAAHRMGVTNVQDPTQIARQSADVDLYVTTNALLLMLDSNAIAGADKSVSRDGYQTIIYTNAVQNQVYYAGVKSEDQQAAQYQFTALFSLYPFNNGNNTYPGYPTPLAIPDGSPALPGVANVTAYAAITGNARVRNVVVTNVLTHQNFGDLLGTLSHNGQKYVALNNHTFGNGNITQTFVYDDTGNTPSSSHVDGPGKLTSFIGDQVNGQWILTEIDNALTHTGRVDGFTIHIDPHIQNDLPPGGTNGVVLENCVTVDPGAFQYDFVDVPFNGTDVQICVSNGVAQPLQLYIKNNALPTTTSYDYTTTIDSTNGCIDVSIYDLPPLQAGTLYFGIYNPSASTPVYVCYQASLTINPVAVLPLTFNSTNSVEIQDDAVTYSQISLTNDQPIASIGIGVAINYPRVSDLVLTLISPSGQRYTLFDERGGLTATNLGHINITTNFFGTQVAGGANANTNVLSPVPTSGNLFVNYNMFTIPDSMTIYYDGTILTNTGLISGPGIIGPLPYSGNATSITIVMNEGGNPNATTRWIYTPQVISEDYTYFTFTEDTDLTTTPVKFAGQPFDLLDYGTNYTLSDFEQAASGDYFAYMPPTNIFDPFGGWYLYTNSVAYGTNFLGMLSNRVSVVTDPATAQDGSNFLALANGTITRVVPTTPNRNYNITYYYRGPGIAGWWRGEGNATDSADPETRGNNGMEIGRFEYPAGEVGQAFQFEDAGEVFRFAGTNTYIQVRQSPSLDVGQGGGFTVEGWINPTNVSFQQPLVEWLAPVPTNFVSNSSGENTNIVYNYDINMTLVAGPFLNPATSHYYYLLDTTNWSTSELWANKLGGHLATIRTANEENWVDDTFAQFGDTNRALWIGLSYDGTNFSWTSGETNLFYTNWVSGQPFNCTPSSLHVAIINPTNSQPGLWTLADDFGTTCWPPPSNHIYGVVEVNDIQTNGVQFWISVTNPGCLYANIVDTNSVPHIISSAPGLVQSNIYQHVALTYDTNSGIANLYYNGTNVASTNLGVFVPKTGGDVLLGKDVSRVTNNYYAGKMDELSIYNRSLSPSEINAIYSISAYASNGVTGKFDPAITPALGLAEAQVAVGGATNRILGIDNAWQYGGSSFTASGSNTTVQITGIEPGMLLDSFAVYEQPPADLYVLPEQIMTDLIGQSTMGTWTLEIRDARAGPGSAGALGQLVSWQLQFIYRATTPVSIPLSPYQPATNVVPAGKTAYFTVNVPSWASYATNLLLSSTSAVDLLFNQTTPPTGTGAGDYTFLSASTAGSYTISNSPPSTPLLLPGRQYYLGVRNSGTADATVSLEVDYDITTLSNGVPVLSAFNTNDTTRYFAYDVSPSALEATFQLLKQSANVDLVVSKGLPLPNLTNANFGSFNASTADDDVYVLTNSSPVALSAGRWYIGEFKRDSGPATNAVLAKELDALPTVMTLTNNVPFTYTAGAGAALTNFFLFTVTNSAQAIHFELYNMSGDGDLTVQTNAPPLAPPFWASSQQPGLNAELIFLHTNSAVTNLNQSFYLGVPNHETNLITYTVVAVVDTNGYFPAFPDAEGAGGGAAGGRGGDVYHVTSLNDSGPGTLRDAVDSATSGRTVVFDLSGTITLQSPLMITNSNLTIAGQSAPGDGITLKGYVTSVQGAHDVVIRYVRFRPGDVNCDGNEDDSLQFFNVSNAVADHISASWSINANVRAYDANNLTVQWSVLSDSLYNTNSCNTNYPPGFGTIARYGNGVLSLHHNLYADNYAGNPRLGDNIRLDFVDNVVYNWGPFAGFSTNDIADNPEGFTNYLNYICNYLIAGYNTASASSNLASTNIAFWAGTPNTWIFQTNNFIDSNTNGILDGANTGWNMFGNSYTKADNLIPLPVIGVDEAFIAYEKVLDFAGTAMEKRDIVDQGIAGNVRAQTGVIPTTEGAWPVLNSTALPADYDQDGIPDYWEITLGQNPAVFSANNYSTGDGYTDLEEYLNWLAAPHALTVTNQPVGVDLYRLCGNTGNLTFFLTNVVRGTAYLTNNFDTNGVFIRSNSLAVFTPAIGATNEASFGFYVTNTDTVAYFGPVKVSVFNSSVPITNAVSSLPLVNGATYCTTNMSGTNGVDYYSYNVSTNAYSLQFQVSNISSNLDLYVRYGLPLPGPGLFDYSVVNAGTNVETITILTNMAPVPLTNGVWYLAVSNASGSAPVSYCVTVTELLTLPNIVTLTNGIPYVVTNLPVSGTDYYHYVVTNNPPARVQFEVDNPSGAVALVARKGLPLPSLTGFDYISTNAYTNDQLIVVLTNSAPVPLTQGDWYLAVVNLSSFGPVDYSVKATEWPVTGLPVGITNITYSSNAFCVAWNSLPGVYYYVQGIASLIGTNWTTVSPQILATGYSTEYCVPLPSSYNFFRVEEGLVLSTNTAPTIITLTNGIPYVQTNTAANGEDYYHFVVSTNAARAQFEVDDPSGDVTLVARKGLPVPTLASYDYLSQNPGTNDELILVLTNSVPVALTAGDWYLTVVNVSTGPVSYSVKATEWPVTGEPPGVTNIVYVPPQGTNPASLCLTWNSLPGAYYYIQGIVDVAAANWMTISPTIVAVTNLTTYCVDLPSPYNFFQVVEGLVLSSNTGPQIITLTNAIPYNQAASPASASDYYHFVVSSNSARTQFEVDNPSGNVALVARRGMPLPALTNFDYISQNPYTNDQLIVVFTNSSPVPLTNGDWYLAVVNVSGGPVAYSVKATEWSESGEPIDVLGTGYVPPSGTNPASFCVTWASLPGVYYYVEGRADLSSTNWTVVSPTILAVTNTSEYCLSLPSAYNYFQVAEGVVVSSFAVPPTISATYTNGGFLLLWNGPVTARFQPEWSPFIPATSWNLFSNIVTSATGQFSFFDDGLQTGGFGATRFYRVLLLP